MVCHSPTTGSYLDLESDFPHKISSIQDLEVITARWDGGGNLQRIISRSEGSGK